MVYGTAQPTKGVPLVMHKAAYALPQHNPNHWLSLMAADRVESGENLAKELVIPGRQMSFLRHYARQISAEPVGTAVVVGALGFGLFRLLKR